MSAPYAIAATVLGVLGGFALGTTWPLHPLNEDLRRVGRVIATAIGVVCLLCLVVGNA